MKTNKCTSFVSVHFTRFVSNKFTSSVASVPAIVDDDKKLEFSSQRPASDSDKGSNPKPIETAFLKCMIG